MEQTHSQCGTAPPVTQRKSWSSLGGVGVGLTNWISNSRVPEHSISSAPNVPIPLFDQNDPKRRLTQRTNKRFFSSFFVCLFLFYRPQGMQRKQILSKAISSSLEATGMRLYVPKEFIAFPEETFPNILSSVIYCDIFKTNRQLKPGLRQRGFGI